MNLFRSIALAILVLLVQFSVFSQTKENILKDTITVNESAKKHWYENLSIRGYAQIRYNKLLETNSNLGCEQCDRSWGGEGGFFIRRMRIIFYGQISKQVYVYVQPDFASSPATDRLHFAQLRDAYVDVGLDKNNEFRFRIGQSKVPFGFENMQSSQNRLTLDRNDALNSAVSNERDMGVFFYWAPKEIRKTFSELVSSGLKGSGDYGVIGMGAYNGQTANNPELNSEPHIVGRVSYPFTLRNKQIIEMGIQGYYGKYVVPKANVSTGVKFVKDLNYVDQRIAASFILYPKPFGIQLEYNMGTGPKYNNSNDSIEESTLEGGYALINYQLNYKKHLFIPFARAQYYNGGKKHEKDARSYLVKELEIGIEWQPVKNFELVAMYTISDRTFNDFAKKNNRQTGNLLRLQAQVNF
jgi:Phosphate-selective porin O and P